MKTIIINKSYKDKDSLKGNSLPKDYLSDYLDISFLNDTNTGFESDYIEPILSLKDDIFRRLPQEIKNNVKIRPFLKALSFEFSIHKKKDYSYLPLMVGEQDDDSIILDWIYETISISFFFMKDKNLYSVTRYDPNKNSYSQTIEQMLQDQYKEIAAKVLSQIG